MTWLFSVITAATVWTLIHILVYKAVYQRRGKKPIMAQGRRSGNSDLVDIAGEIRGETERAFRLYDGKTVEWVPKSLCEWDEIEKIMTMPEWMALEKGFL